MLDIAKKPSPCWNGHYYKKLKNENIKNIKKQKRIYKIFALFI